MRLDDHKVDLYDDPRSRHVGLAVIAAGAAIAVALLWLIGL